MKLHTTPFSLLILVGVILQSNSARGGDAIGFGVNFSITPFSNNLSTNVVKLVLNRSCWNYWDRGTYPGRNWAEPGFDDQTWSTGYGEFGYGSIGETTVLNYGPDANHKYITSYFRHTFSDHELKGKWHSVFFKNENPIVIELGCGRGEYTVNLAEKFPQKNFIGIDWKGARLWRGAKTSHVNEMTNVAFLRIQILNILSFFSANEVGEIWITFPDPQPQFSRVRKRLTSPRFMNMYKQILCEDGIIHLKTDNKGFYDYTLEEVIKNKYRKIYSTDDLYHSDFENEILSIKTTYENIFLEQGSKICYLKFSFS